MNTAPQLSRYRMTLRRSQSLLVTLLFTLFSCALFGPFEQLDAAPFPQAAPFESEILPESPSKPAEPDTDTTAETPPAGPSQLREREKLIRGWPLFYKERGPGDREETDAFFFLYHHLRVGPEHSRRVAPFYFSRWNRETKEHDTLFFPFYYSRARGASWRWISLPLDVEYDAAEQETRWGAPVVLSLYRGTKSPDGSSHRLGVWPLFDLFATENRTTRRTVELFGLFSWRGPAESWLPLYRHQVRFDRLEESTLFPLWYYRNRTRGELPQTRWVFPLLGFWNDSTPEKSTSYWLPILGRRQVAEDRASWTALFGLIGAGHGPDVRWSRFEPFYSSTTSDDHGSYRVLRLYGRDWSKSGESETTHLLPPLGRFSRTRYGYQDRFFPFYFAGGNHRVPNDDPDAPTLPETSYRAIVPFYYRYQSPRIDRRFVFPIYYGATTRSATENGTVAEYGNRVGFPLYWHEWSPGRRSLHFFPLYSQLNDPKRRLDVVLGPLYVRDADRSPGGEVSHSFLWPLIEKSRSAKGWHAHVLPIWWSTREGNSAFDLIAPLYLRSKTENTSHHWFLPIHGRYRHRSPEAGTIARDFYAGGAITRVRKREPGESEGKTSWSFLGPVAGFSHDVEEEENHSRLLPVWWRTSAPDSSTTVALPLAYHQRRGQGAEARTLTVVGGPLWVDSRTPERREFGVLYPFTRFRRSETSRSDQIFLLYGTSEDRSTRVPSSRFRISPFFSSSRGGEEPSKDGGAGLENVGGAHEDELALGSRQGDIDASSVAEEFAEVGLVGVGFDEGDEHALCVAALEAVDRREHVVEIGGELVGECLELRAERRQNRQVARLRAEIEEVSHEGDDHLGLGKVGGLRDGVEARGTHHAARRGRGRDREARDREKHSRVGVGRRSARSVRVRGDGDARVVCAGGRIDDVRDRLRRRCRRAQSGVGVRQATARR
ncbi:MAG: hypothetical protein AAF488_12195, partial [Planctomycetota bacterium]